MQPIPFRELAKSLRSAELRAIGRVVMHAVVVGLVVGVIACTFYTLLALSERALLEGLAGYEPLRPAGEHAFDIAMKPRPFNPWVLAFIPALGGLAAGTIMFWLAHETTGGGGDAYIEAFHRQSGQMRKRVAFVKIVATCLTLGSGGSGGREGPTMQVGASIGATMGRVLGASPRERRLLAVCGTAAGLSAIFGAPLGAALFSTEVLYRDDFEADALIPAILASVTAHGLFVAVIPDAAALFAHAPRYPFHPSHLPLYALLAVAVSAVAAFFVRSLEISKRLFSKLRVPVWLRPAIGGLGLGVSATIWIVLVNPALGMEGRGIGILGSGYGAAQGAITGGEWIPDGWWGVGLLFVLVLIKIIATCLTLGSGGSAGDFGPSLAIGGLVGGAFGRAAQILVSPEIDPGAFALVGMGTFYGGIAHTPVSSLVMVCEMAGTYDLLPSLMLSSGLAFVLLRKVSLYKKQPRSRFESPVHAGEESLDLLKRLKVRDVYRPDHVVTIGAAAPLGHVVEAVLGAPEWQDSFPVLGQDGALQGIISGDVLRGAMKEGSLGSLVIAADVMLPATHVTPADDLHTALVRLLESNLRELPVIDDGKVAGLLDEAQVTRAYHDYLGRLADEPPPESIR